MKGSVVRRVASASTVVTFVILLWNKPYGLVFLSTRVRNSNSWSCIFLREKIGQHGAFAVTQSLTIWQVPFFKMDSLLARLRVASRMQKWESGEDGGEMEIEQDSDEASWTLQNASKKRMK